ncbi:hypothetical protein EJ06DRAFT_530045 [Trichodelitschia bisporula]|uniref:WW-domain-binding protein n=1 Tax=Trichodelitschia bisporula TaxID=703511 RepID=A0A6G1HYY9_9PEZI|nr:hypothetical protein EJ06DRAFT_530045 [Trichodelitschia bisporula]
MSINWVMHSETEGYTNLPGEQRLYTSPPRTALTLQSMNKYPGKEPFSIQSSTGCVHLTNRRMIYLPANPTPTFSSFAAPILNLHDTHVAAPFFGPNVWSSVVQPVPGGNLPPQHAALELKLTFKDGGAFDFHSLFERLKERCQQAVEVARESGTLSGDVNSAQGPGVDVFLDELPAYEVATASPSVSPGAATTIAATDAVSPPGLAHASVPVSPVTAGATSPREERFAPPQEPPPGYEAVQNQSVQEELWSRLRQESERRPSE